MDIKQLACPKCGGTIFKVYQVVIEDFFSKDFFARGSPLILVLHKCVNCGWQSLPLDEEKLRRRLMNMLMGNQLEEEEVFTYANQKQ